MASVPTFVKLLLVCVCVKERKKRQTRAREECICMCLCCDWCDRCSHWTGTAKYCSSRGQMLTCHCFVLMLTRSGGFAYPFGRKMITSQVCRWCCRHIPFLLFSPFFFVSICLHHLYHVCQSEYQQALILSAISLCFLIFIYFCLLAHYIYMKVSL